MIINYIKEEDVKVINPPGKGLVWTIDEECLYDLPVKLEYVDIFLSNDIIEDKSSEYPDHEGIVVRFIKNDIAYDFATSEYFGSILLSDPVVLDLADYPYGRYVQSPYAKFDGQKFIILNRDTTDLMPWYPGKEK